MPPYAPPQITMVFEEESSVFLCMLSMPWVARQRGTSMVPSPATIISIRTRDTHCLISPCKIPANWLYHPQCGSLH